MTVMTIELQTSDNWKRSLYALTGAFLMAILVFLIVPLTHTTQPQTPETIDIRKVLVVKPPAPMKPSETMKPPTVKERTPKPAFQKQPPPPDLTQLKLALNPGIDEALAAGLANTSFEIEADAMSSIQDLFTAKNLPETLRIINNPKFQFPKELIRRGIKEARVVALIEIDEKGRAELINVKSSTHPLLIKEAEQVIRQAQFTKPLIDGVPQRVRIPWSIILHAPK